MGFILAWNECIILNSLFNKYFKFLFCIEDIRSCNPYKQKLFEVLSTIKKYKWFFEIKIFENQYSNDIYREGLKNYK